VILYLAGVKFTIEGVPEAPVPPFHHLFMQAVPGERPDESCDVTCLGPDAGLEKARMAPGFHFERVGEGARICGVDTDGTVAWRIEAAAGYGKMRAVWHPTRFEKVYSASPYGLWQTFILMPLVLRLIPLEGIFMHGSAQVLDGAGILCTGPSGRGKSTISRLFHAAGVPVLSDEHPILRPVAGGGFRVYGSPWPSSGRFALNASAPLKKIYFLEHGPANVIEPLTPQGALQRFIECALIPWMDPAFFDPFIRPMESLLRTVPAAVLRFVPDGAVVPFVRADLAKAD
jgi:hypothetical protein